MNSIFSTNLRLLFFTISVIWAIGCSKEKEVSISPQQALNNFYTNQVAEDQLMDPLILAGSEVVPVLLVEISKKDMPRRRYAIGALGNIQDKSALSALENILMDDTEKDYFRCDALNSIGMIDFLRARELATQNKDSSVECLLSQSTKILATEYEAWLSDNYMRRSQADARSGKHN